VAQSLSNLGRLRLMKKDFAGAENYLNQALTMRRKLFPKGSRELARNLYDIGELERTEGKLADAEASHRDAWTMRRTLFGESDSSTIASLLSLCSVLEAEGKLREAADLGNAEVLNRIALRLATDPTNPDRSNAVVYAEKAVQATGRTNRMYLTTLAAAYAAA